MKKSSCLTPVFTRALPALLFMLALIFNFVSPALATTFTKTVPGTSLTIPSTYPEAGGVVIVLTGANGNVYYQFIQPSSMFVGYQNTGTPAAWRGNPFQIGPVMALNCGAVTTCSTYLGGSITSMAIRFTALDGDNKSGDFDFNDLTLRINGTDVGNWSTVATETTNTAGTSASGSGLGFGNNTLDTGWFQTTNTTLLSNVLSTGNMTATVFDRDPNDNYWDFRSGNDANTTIVPLNVAPGVSLDKQVNPSTQTTFLTVGQVVNYTYDYRNIGSVYVENIAVTDNKIATVTCPATPARLNPGDTKTCTGSYTVTQADVDAGTITNIATATGTPQAGTLGPVTDTVTITGPAFAPFVNLIKFASSPTFGAAGTSVNYLFQVQNTGNVTLNSVVITDPLLPGLSCSVVPITPGATVNATCTGNTKTVTVADVDAGVINNTASIVARPLNGASANDTASFSVTGPTRTPGVALRKIATTITDTNGNGRLDAGDTQNYDLVVTNTGNVTLANITVTDPGAVVTGGPLASLAPGVVNSTTFKAARVITLAQMNAGVINNQASVTSTPPAGVAGPTTDLSHPTSDGANANTVTPLTRAPAVSLAKTATQTSFNAVGNTINYSYLVRNTGNVTLTVPVTIADNKIPSAGITCPAFPGGGLLPNGTYTCTGIYTIVQADLDTGKVTNVASASSGTAATPVVTSPTDSVTVNASVSAGVTITKGVGTIADTNSSGRTDVGDTVTYIITVANTGNVTLNAVTVTDPLPGATVTGSPLATLASGTSNNTIRVNYVLTQADLNAGKVDNQASVTANPPTPAPAVTDVSDPTSGTANSTTTTPVTQVRSIALTKATGTVADTNSSGRVDAGDIISNAITVRNTGTVTLTGIIVTDPKAGVTVTGANVGTLLPGATSTGPITASYTLTQADIDAGTVQNQAAVSGTPPSGAPATDTSHPSLFTANAPTPTPLTTTGSIAVVKTAGAPTTALGALSTVTDAGDRITYTFTVTNTGAQTLNTVGVTDPKLTGITCSVTTLAPNASTTCSAAPYTLTLTDVNAGSVTNQATASGTRPGGAIVTDLSGSTNANNTQTVTPIAATPRIALVKTGGAPTIALGSNAAVTDPGDTISYSFSVTNTGSVTVNSLAVTDPKVSGITCVATSLAPGISTTCSGAPYVLTLADLNAGQVENQATASALSPGGATTTDASDPSSQTGNAPTQTPVTQTPRVALLKVAGAIIDANSNGRQDAGDRIAYTFTVTNTGTVTLTNIRVADPQISVAGSAIVSLAPGASNTANFTAVRVLTQADIDAGNYTNQAVVTAVSPSGPITDNSDPSSNAGNAPTVVPIAPQRALSVAKTANVSSFNAPGTTINYSYEVTNTGTVTLSQPFSVSDNKIPSVVCPATPATLGPKQSLICAASYTTTQADVDAGGVTNIASASGGGTTSPSDSVTVPAVRTPTMAVVKSTVAPVTGLSVGDVIDYEYKITNTGNVTLTGPFTINDNRISSADITCPAGNVAIGTSIVCSASYTITGDDVLVGVVTNTATASNAQTTSPVISLTIPNNASPALELDKIAITSGFDAAGDIVTYEYTVVNSGNTDFVRFIDIIDNKAGTFVCIKATTTDPFKRGQKATCSVNYTVTQADVDAGFVTNDAVAQTLFGSSTPVASNPDTATVNAAQDPSIRVTKTASSSITGVGQILTYRMRVLNDGNVTVSNIVITDPLIPSLSCTIASLAPTISDNSCTGTYTVRQADIDAGQVLNTVTATGVTPQGTSVTDTGSLTLIAPAANPTLSLDKIAEELSFDSVGQDLVYNFTVRNTGNVTLTNVRVTDPLVPAFLCVIPLLAPGNTDNTSCSTTYRVTQADVDNGSITNTASVTGTPARGTPPTATDSVTTGGPTRQPRIAIVKSTASTPSAAGQTLNYRFEVSNSGNVTITGVTVTDPKCAATPVKISGDTGNDNILGITEVHVYTCTSIAVTQAQVDLGVVSNTVTANGTSIVGPAPTVTSSLNTPVTSSPAITLVKSASVPTTNLGANTTTVDAGDRITYSFTLANAGNVTLNPVSVTDAKLGTVTCAATSLAPGISTSCTAAAYTITQTDMDAGAVTNTATGRGKPPTGADTTDKSGSSTTNDTPTVTALAPAPAITLVKTAGAPSTNLGNSNLITDAGDRITYTFTVRNAGNVTLNPISVSDPKLPGLTCAATSLAPGVSTTCPTNNIYTITQADMDAGLVTNSATASGKPPTGANATDVSGTNATNNTPTTRVLPQSPIVRLTKIAALPSVNLGANTTITDAGDTIAYTFNVRNSGSVTLTTISVTDPKVTSIVCVATTLAPATQTTCTGNAYIIMQADMDSGSAINTANASAKPPTGANVTDISGTDFTNNTPTNTPLTGVALIRLVKTAGVPTVAAGANTIATDAGDSITYSFTVTNRGTVTLNPVSVTDVKLGTVTCAATSLAPNISTTCSAPAYTITLADMNTGSVTNTATASGTPPSGPAVTDVSGSAENNDTQTNTPLTQTPRLTLVKTAAAPTTNLGTNTTATDAGDTITYSFTVANTGTVTLNPVSVSDVKLGTITCAATSVAPGISTTCSAPAYVITLADMNAGSVSNTATATGKPPTGPDATDVSGTDATNDTPTNTPLTATPSLTLVKTAGTPTVNLGPNATATDAGDTITYAFAVRNSGTVTLNPVSVTDVKLGTVTCVATTLAPNVSTTCSAAPYIITLADMDTGSVSNTATASGTPPTGPAVTDTSGTSPANDTPTNVPLTATPSLTLVKAAGVPTVAAGAIATATDAGDTIAYSFTVRNSGTVTLNPVSVTDAKITNISCAATSLAPGLSTTCAGDPYIITLADMNAGSVTNTATATGVPPVALGLPDATDTSGNDATNDTPTNTVLTGTPALTLVKSTGTATVALGINPAVTDAGDTIAYSFTVRNAGTVTLTGVAVSDVKVPNIVCAATTLAPGASTNCSGDPYVITLTDMNAGQVTNTATGTGTPPTGPAVTDVSGTSPNNDIDTVTPLTPTPRLTLVKTSAAPTTNLGADTAATDTGDTITYSFEVANSGNVVLNPVSVSDPKLGTITCAATSLVPGASTICSAPPYVITLTDMNTGSVTNTAIATGKPPVALALPDTTDISGTDVSNDTNTVTPLTATPRITLVKTAGTPTVAAGAIATATDAGDTISYSFVVANTGTVTLNPVSVSDVKLGTITCVATTLAPGVSTNCSAPDYVITLADMNLGSVTNTATVSGKPPVGANATDVSGSDATNNLPTETLLAAEPSLTLVKTAGTPTIVSGVNPAATDAGDTITYSFAVENTGTVTLNPVSVSDVKLGAVTCVATTLAPGALTNCSAPPYVITLTDMNAGSVTNTALASGTPPTGPAVTDTSGTSPANDTPTSTPLNATPRLTLVKTAAAPTVAAGADNTVIDAGDSITYSFAVANTGTVTLNPVSVTDVKLGAVTCAATSLVPGASTNCSAAPYVITLADMNTGSVTNTAIASGTPPIGPAVTDRSGTDAANDDDTFTPLATTPRIALVKTAGAPTISAGLNAGATDAGDTIAYSFTVANIGGVTLNPVSVSDVKVANIVCADTVLVPGDSTICTGDPYIITLDDMNAGSVDNTALATGTPPIGTAVTDTSGTGANNDTPTNTVLTSIPSLTLVKSGSAPSVNLGVNASVTDAGDTIAYSFTVTNTGPVTLNPVTISDAKVSSITCAATSLAPGNATTCTGNPYVLTQADMDAGSTTNTAIATGTPPTGPAVTDTSGTNPSNDTPTETPLIGIPHLTLVKSAGAATINLGANATYTDAGDQISYRFRVINTGPVSISSIVVTDAKVSNIVCEQTSLVSGASTQCTGNPYTITDADVTALRVVNTASASGLSATGVRVSDVSDDPSDLANVDVNGDGDPDDVTVLVLAAPPSGTITMQKTASVSTAKSGEAVAYTLNLTNTQTFAAGPLSVVDTLPQGFTFVDGSATLDGAAVIPAVAGQAVNFSNVTVPANSSLSLRLSVRVGNVSSGAYTNRVRAFDSTGTPASNEATATVTVSGEAVFDCGDIIGKVYDDKNRNNIQDKGEPGMPGVRLATVRGVLITTDQYGRYNVPCAELPDPDIGSNFILKLDTRTLPSGYVVITENPRDVRLTAGKLTKLNFGVAQARVLRVELTASAFEQGSLKPSEKLEKGIESLVDAAREELSFIQLTYVLKPAEPRNRAEERLKTVSDEIRAALKKAGLRAKTPVETKIITR